MRMRLRWTLKFRALNLMHPDADWLGGKYRGWDWVFSARYWLPFNIRFTSIN